MAVMVTVEVCGQTQAGYEGMLAVLADVARGAPGFIVHASHPAEGGWRVTEIWNSKLEADQFFARNVAPHLPAGVRPRRSVQELHTVLKS